MSKAVDKRGGADISWFGPWLRGERRSRGISSNQLAQHFPSRTGGETGCVRNWELGLNLPTPDQFNLLCRVLDLPFAKIAEAEREVTGQHAAGLHTGGSGVGAHGVGAERRDLPATPEAVRWQGWGTALKPGWEIIVVARKPLGGSTVAANILQYGTGGLNIDACRLSALTPKEVARSGKSTNGDVYGEYGVHDWKSEGKAHTGRWPANVVLDSDAAAELDQQSGVQRDGVAVNRNRDRDVLSSEGGWGFHKETEDVGFGGSGGASRFYFTAKASTDERIRHDGVSHPTVKPLSLMRWLVKLVTQPGGVVLDPFAGSGTTVEACILEGFRCIAVERETPYLPLITQRINRRLDPVAYLEASGDDLGLFGEIA